MENEYNIIDELGEDLSKRLSAVHDYYLSLIDPKLHSVASKNPLYNLSIACKDLGASDCLKNIGDLVSDAQQEVNKREEVLQENLLQGK